MWEAIQVIRKTNGNLQQENDWFMLTMVLCDVKHLVCSPLLCFMPYFPPRSPQGENIEISPAKFAFIMRSYFPSLVHLMYGICRTQWGRAKCSKSIKWNPADFYCLQLESLLRAQAADICAGTCLSLIRCHWFPVRMGLLFNLLVMYLWP